MSSRKDSSLTGGAIVVFVGFMGYPISQIEIKVTNRSVIISGMGVN